MNSGRAASLQYLVVATFLLAGFGRAADTGDWPVLHGNARHDGYRADFRVTPPYRLAWARHFSEERLGTAMEPVVSEELVYVATHAGVLHGLDAKTGEHRWSFVAKGPFLHSPAVSDGVVVAGCIDGSLYAVDAKNGSQRWAFFTGHGGSSASPLIAGGRVFLGTRGGEFHAISLETGKGVWRQSFKAPIRQTSAYDDGRVFVMSEDLRLHCLDAESGKVVWTTAQVWGQTARDYYPVVVRSGGRAYVVVRTNPVLNMALRIARDRHVLASGAGVDDGDWRKLDAWAKSPESRGTPELWSKEQERIEDYLGASPDARTFYVFDGETGEAEKTLRGTMAPVLWAAGCQGVGAPPCLTSDGRLLVFCRSAYGNWSHGVAPLVALGLYDIGKNRIELLTHQFPEKPAWNTFWGTADESQNFTVAGETLLIVHQGTLSGYDLKAKRLFAIWGERDTFGGFKVPRYANEWHGPGRGGVALAEGRIYWITGSRLLCLEPGQKGGAVEDAAAGEPGTAMKAATTERSPGRVQSLKARLEAVAEECASRVWAPLYVEPGLAGREFCFDNSGEVFEAWAWAYPHLSGKLQKRVRDLLASEWEQHAPFTEKADYSLTEGERREWFRVPAEVLSPLKQEPRAHRFGNMSAVRLYAERCGEWDRVRKAWPELKGAFGSFKERKWRFDPAKGDLYANRYYGALAGYKKIAERFGDADAAREASEMMSSLEAPLLQWWAGAGGAEGVVQRFAGSSNLDPFIGGGDGRLFFKVIPHRHRPALVQGLTPELLGMVQHSDPNAVREVWGAWNRLCPTWYLAGEERQVHFGENFVDSPRMALDFFKLRAWMEAREGEGDGLEGFVDVPVCKGDLYYMTKLAVGIETGKR